MNREPTALIGYDGSQEAAGAVRCAAALLAPRRVVVACVWDSLASLLLHTEVADLRGSIREAAEELDAEDRERAAALAEGGAQLARAAGLEAEGRVLSGKPKAWPALLAEADALGARVIVVGRRGLGGVRSALLGSVSSGLLHHSRRPLLVAPPPGPAGRDDTERAEAPLLLGYDGSAEARRAIEAAGALLSVRQAIVETAWCEYGSVAAAGAAGLPPSVAADAARKLDEEIETGALATAGEGAELARAAGLEARAEVTAARHGVAGTLLERAGEHGAAALAVGSRGRTAVGAALLGSVASSLLFDAPLPLLVVPPGDIGADGA